jgi:Spy/CpxP family protein refolding chaperone
MDPMTRSTLRLICFVTAVATAAVPGGAPATAQHHGHGAAAPSEGHRAAQACADESKAVIADGRGFGMAFAADQNGYPGPMHVLELKDTLKLTPDQERRARELYAAVRAEVPKSTRLLEAERRLERLFADGRATEDGVRAAVGEVEQARAEVRLVHLLAHLRTRDLLSDEQRQTYHRARWSAPR